MVSQFDVGDKVRLTGTFTDTGGTPADPSKVTLWVRAPSSTVFTITSTGALTNPAVGTYHHDVVVDSSGLWLYRLYSTGTIQAAEESSFIARRRFVPSTST